MVLDPKKRTMVLDRTKGRTKYLWVKERKVLGAQSSGEVSSPIRLVSDPLRVVHVGEGGRCVRRWFLLSIK